MWLKLGEFQGVSLFDSRETIHSAWTHTSPKSLWLFVLALFSTFTIDMYTIGLSISSLLNEV
jgi:hypothetical protein